MRPIISTGVIPTGVLSTGVIPSEAVLQAEGGISRIGTSREAELSRGPSRFLVATSDNDGIISTGVIPSGAVLQAEGGILRASTHYGKPNQDPNPFLKKGRAYLKKSRMKVRLLSPFTPQKRYRVGTLLSGAYGPPKLQS
jgi:hypothetical protein